MHFRHFFKFKYLTDPKHSAFWPKTGPGFQIVPEKTLSDSSHNISNHKTSATIFHHLHSVGFSVNKLAPPPSDPAAEKNLPKTPTLATKTE
jgi:hypothetical protein